MARLPDVSVARGLADFVGADHVLTDPDRCVAYGTDWTRRWSVTPQAVVRPGSTDEVSGVLGWCAARGVGVVPQGGNTGLVGGSVPNRPEQIVLSTLRLTGLEAVDHVSRQVTVGAGATIAAVQAHAGSAGLAYGVDLASRDSATVGGTLATNAGGIRVVAHGDSRAQLVGLQAVLPDGSVVDHLAGLPKDSAGYDLSGLLVGSEGTLGVVTAARLRLVSPLPSGRITSLLGVASVRQAQVAVDQPGVLAAELVVGAAMELVCEVTGLPFPLSGRWPYYVLVETVQPPDLPDGSDAVVDRRLWAYRERLTEAVATLGVVHKLDVAVPGHRLVDLVEGLPAAWAPFQGFVFGHLAEANLHVEIVGAAPDDDAVDERVLRLVAGLGGTISAEHGVGRAKAKWLGLSRSDAEMAAMRGIKTALDPHRIMNPGVLLG